MGCLRRSTHVGFVARLMKQAQVVVFSIHFLCIIILTLFPLSLYALSSIVSDCVRGQTLISCLSLLIMPLVTTLSVIMARELYFYYALKVFLDRVAWTRFSRSFAPHNQADRFHIIMLVIIFGYFLTHIQAGVFLNIINNRLE
ncbi:hypothetical protein WT27_02290 [Burkholderia territorii]|uniref:Uncharacterized protein n=1 Tax=Burkholderia territorii TaxID=1503055 RepID=A0A106E8L7_9BURK|nr:hypothetical protein WT27_02290 [Burkholderia territorii]KVX43017.1 hypothetical protein WT31_02095 [Burkholderia territorii]